MRDIPVQTPEMQAEAPLFSRSCIIRVRWQALWLLEPAVVVRIQSGIHEVSPRLTATGESVSELWRSGLRATESSGRFSVSVRRNTP